MHKGYYVVHVVSAAFYNCKARQGKFIPIPAERKKSASQTTLKHCDKGQKKHMRRKFKFSLTDYNYKQKEIKKTAKTKKKQ